MHGGHTVSNKGRTYNLSEAFEVKTGLKQDDALFPDYIYIYHNKKQNRKNTNGISRNSTDDTERTVRVLRRAVAADKIGLETNIGKNEKS